MNVISRNLVELIKTAKLYSLCTFLKDSIFLNNRPRYHFLVI